MTEDEIISIIQRLLNIPVVTTRQKHAHAMLQERYNQLIARAFTLDQIDENNVRQKTESDSNITENFRRLYEGKPCLGKSTAQETALHEALGKLED